MEFFHPSFTRHGARDLKDIKRGNQLKSSKRHDMEENTFNEGPDENSSSSGQSGTHKRMRIDYSIFRTDVVRLQQNLDDLESDLKQHSMQVPSLPTAPSLTLLPPHPPCSPPSPSPAPSPACLPPLASHCRCKRNSRSSYERSMRRQWPKSRPQG